MGERLWDAVRAVLVCMHQQLVCPQAVHLNVSCQNLSAPGTPEQISALSECWFCYSWPKKKRSRLHSLCVAVLPHWALLERLTCFSSVNPEEKHAQSQTQVTYLSIQQPRCKSAGGSVHSLHRVAVNSFSYPVKGRVNPPSIWHTAHLVERHSGRLEGGGEKSRGGAVAVRRRGLFGRCRPEQMDFSVA